MSALDVVRVSSVAHGPVLRLVPPPPAPLPPLHVGQVVHFKHGVYKDQDATVLYTDCPGSEVASALIVHIKSTGRAHVTVREHLRTGRAPRTYRGQPRKGVAR